jgi:uncharacterized protein YbaR (Trm112 family)
MFDWYQPVPELTCPVCRKPLREWQGTDGPNGLFLWRQGKTAPVEQLIEDAEVKLGSDQIAAIRLPPAFTIYCYDCGCPFPVEALCRVQNGTWEYTEVVNQTNATQKREETQAEWKARIAWLQGGTRK